MFTRIMRSLRNPEPDIPPWSLWTALAVVVVAFVAMIVGTVIALNLLGQGETALLSGWILGSAVIILHVWSTFRSRFDGLKLGPSGTRLSLVLLFAVGMAVLIDLIDLAVTGRFEPAPELVGLLSASAGIGGWLIAILFMLVAQPVAEELVFRAILFPVARIRLGGWGGLIASALLYGLFHLLAYTTGPGDFWHTLVTPVLAGAVIGGVRANTRSTRAAIIAHMGFSIFALLKLLAAV